MVSNVGGNVISEIASHSLKGDDPTTPQREDSPDRGDLGTAVLKGAVAGGVAAMLTPAAAAGTAKLGRAIEKIDGLKGAGAGLSSQLGSAAIGGAGGNVAGGAAADALDARTDRDKAFLNAGVNALTGGAGAAASHGLHHAASPGANSQDFRSGPGLEADAPKFTLDATPGAIGGGPVQGVSEHLFDKYDSEQDEKSPNRRGHTAGD